MPSAGELFIHLKEFNVAVCRDCHHAVDPPHVFKHLVGDKHNIPKQEAESVAAEVGKWPGLLAANSFKNPTILERPVPCLHLFRDGLACAVEGTCTYVCRTLNTMRVHWKGHGFKLSGRGGSGPSRVAERNAQMAKGLRRPVLCQRFFVNADKSSYVQVMDVGVEEANQAVPVGADEALTHAWSRAGTLLEVATAEGESTVVGASKGEVSPWLERTGWVPFFRGLNRADIIGLVRSPGDAKDDAVEMAIWRAMKDVAHISQAAVRNSGKFVNFQAVRSDWNQTEYKPLQTYQDKGQIGKHCLPWQQILMFVVRCNGKHRVRGLTAPLTKWQVAAFEELMDAASEAVETARVGEGEGEGEEMEAEAVDDARETARMTRLQSACLEMCIALLNHKVSRHEYESAVVRALAALGCEPMGGGGWRGPESYTSILSSVMKVSQFMVVCKAVRLTSTDNPDDCTDAAEPPAVFGRKKMGGGKRVQRSSAGADTDAAAKKSCVEWVKCMVESFMMRGTSSPMQWSLDLRAYGMKIDMNTSRDGSVSWNDGNRLLYRDLTFTMDEFRKFVHGLVATASTLLASEIVRTGTISDLPPIDWDHLYDDPSNKVVGWNFTRDTRSRFSCDGRTWMFDRFRSSPALRQCFAKENSPRGLNRTFVKQWLGHVESFREKLLLIMHVTGGQPARGTELLSVRHSNTPNGSHRNLFIENGAVVFVTAYHKGYAISGDVKIIHRYLPREVGQLVVWYVWLVLPFVERIEVVMNQSHRPSPFLWPESYTGRAWDTDRITDLLRIETGKSLGCELTVASYRQMSIAIGRRYLAYLDAWGSGQDTESAKTLQERIEQDMDEQAGHSSHIAGLMYARELQEMMGALATKRRRFRLVSEQWHQFLNFESASGTAVGKKRAHPEWDVEAIEERSKRRRLLSEVDPFQPLRALFGRDARFRSRQEEAIRAIQDGASPMVAVMPTAAGKSLLYLLPALAAKTGTTIVVVPLKSLRTDALEHCRQHGIKASVWSRDCQPDGESIVFVTPEAALLPGFADAIQRLCRMRQLDRIVIDECHVLLARNDGFRKQISRLCSLAMAETQMVLLTATLPPTEERRLFVTMGWQELKVTMIRASTVRPNTKYEVKHLGGDNERLRVLRALIAQVKGQADKTKGQIVIYFSSRKRVEKFAEDLGSLYFHAGMMDSKKEIVIRDLRAGKAGVVCATSAIGMGIDIPNIVLVVHGDEPWTLLDYAQESGRAGRDGKHCRAIVLAGGERSNDPLVRRFLESGCRRVHLDSYLDGDAARVRCSDGEVLCDVCERSANLDSKLPPTAVFEGGSHQRGVAETSGTTSPASPSTYSHRTGRSTSHSGRESLGTPPSDVTDRSSLRAPDSSISTASLPRYSGKQQAAMGRLALSQGRSAEERGGEGLTAERIALQDHERSLPLQRRRMIIAEESEVAASIRQRMLLWAGRCMYCIADRQNGSHPPSESCAKRGRLLEVERWTRAYRKELQYPQVGPMCWCCGIPRRVCNRFDAQGKSFLGNSVKCEFNNIIHPVIAALQIGFPEWWGGYLHEECEEHTSRLDVTNKDVLLKFLRDTTPNTRSSFLFDGFLYLTDRYEERYGDGETGGDEEVHGDGDGDGDGDGGGSASRVFRVKQRRDAGSSASPAFRKPGAG